MRINEDVKIIIVMLIIILTCILTFPWIAAFSNRYFAYVSTVTGVKF